METKAGITAAVRKSPSLAAKGWNIYTRPCIYYPAQTAEPCAQDTKRLLKAAQSMIGTGKWAPWDLLPAMGNLGKVRGALAAPQPPSTPSS
eukprot:5497094-Heterocapsa_arctica.AAC.1